MHQVQNDSLRKQILEKDTQWRVQEDELNDLKLYKTETEIKVDQLEKKLKNVERELDVNTNLYRRYEDQNVDLKREFDSQRR